MATMHTKYRCNLCDKIHEEEVEAKTCCDHWVGEVYQCSVCHARFEDEMVADEHCWEHDDDEQDVPTHAELEANGQQRLQV